MKTLKKSTLNLIFFGLLPAFTNSQSNLVLNPSFEDVAADFPCTYLESGNLDTYTGLLNKYYYKINYWRYPSKKDFCSYPGTSDVVCSRWGEARTGRNMAHTGSCEFLVGELSTALVAGKEYTVEFYVKSSTANIQNAGIKFFKDRPKQCGNEKNLDGNPSPDIYIPTHYNLNMDSYTQVSATFKAVDNSKYIVFGIFKDWPKTTGGIRIWWDDVSVTEKSTTPVNTVNLNSGNRHGDFNGDGKTDLLFFGDNSTAVSINKGIIANQGKFDFKGWQNAKRGIFDFWTVGDFNGDGKDDILNAYENEGVKVFLSDGTAFLSGNVWTGYGVAAEKFWTVGDFNGDYKDDLLRTEAGVGVQVLLSTGTAFQNPATWTGAGFGSEGFWTIGDFNGDSKDDILRSTNGIGVQVLLSNGSSFLSPTTWSIHPYGQIEKSWRVGDFNKDGKDDILRTTFKAGDDDVDVLISTGSNFLNPKTWARIDLIPSEVMAGDFNGDKFSDIFYLDRITKTVRLSNGNKFSNPIKYQ